MGPLPPRIGCFIFEWRLVVVSQLKGRVEYRGVIRAFPGKIPFLHVLELPSFSTSKSNEETLRHGRGSKKDGNLVAKMSWLPRLGID